MNSHIKNKPSIAKAQIAKYSRQFLHTAATDWSSADRQVFFCRNNHLMARMDLCFVLRPQHYSVSTRHSKKSLFKINEMKATPWAYLLSGLTWVP